MLAKLLGVQPGITAIIGGGGKTTLLRTLGAELAQTRTVLLCTTTKIFPFSDIPWAGELSELQQLQAQHRLLCAGTLLPESGKLAMPKNSLKELAMWFDYVLVEADGSAGRPLKAHAPHEPVIPEGANQTICVVGASGFGRPIAEAVHRPALYAKLAGVEEYDAASPETEARVLLTEKLHTRVFVNQAETQASLEAARSLAGLMVCPVLAGSLQRGEYELCW